LNYIVSEFEGKFFMGSYEQVWQLPYEKVTALGVSDRIVDDESC